MSGNQSGRAWFEHPHPSFIAFQGGAFPAVLLPHARELVPQPPSGTPDTIGTREEGHQWQARPRPRRLSWPGPDAQRRTFSGRFARQGCRRIEQPLSQTPTRNRRQGATAGSRACADTDGSRHGPVHQDPRQRPQPAGQDHGSGVWPAECVPRYTTPFNQSKRHAGRIYMKSRIRRRPPHDPAAL